MDVRIQIIDTRSRKAVGIVWTARDASFDELDALIPEGYAGLVDMPPHSRFSILPTTHPARSLGHPTSDRW